MKLRIAIQKTGMLTSGVVLLNYSAIPHTVACILALLDRSNWELFEHQPRSPDLATSDYQLFTYLKDCLRTHRFDINGDLMEGCQNAAEQAADFNKCLDPGGDGVEK
jgi:hypothetical protein